MKVLIAIPPEKFRDDELLKVVKVFQDSEVKFDLVSNLAGVVMGIFGKQAKVNRTFESVLLKGNEEYDALIIIGGPGTQVHLWNNTHLHELLRIFNKKEKPIGAIDNAPMVMAKAGLLRKREATVAPGPTVRDMMVEDAIIVNKPVVFKDKIVTANGTEASEEFAKVIVEYLTGDPEFKPTKSKVGFAF